MFKNDNHACSMVTGKSNMAENLVLIRMKDKWKVFYLRYSATCFTSSGAEAKCKHVLHSKRMALILSGQT